MSDSLWHSDAAGTTYAVSYATAFDPPPGEDGYLFDMQRDPGYGFFPAGLPVERIEQWRRANLGLIRSAMDRLGAERGTNLHQLIRLYNGLAIETDIDPIAAPRDADEEDRRLVAEYEWELRQWNLKYPATLPELFRAHFGYADGTPRRGW